MVDCLFIRLLFASSNGTTDWRTMYDSFDTYRSFSLTRHVLLACNACWPVYFLFGVSVHCDRLGRVDPEPHSRDPRVASLGLDRLH